MSALVEQSSRSCWRPMVMWAVIATAACSSDGGATIFDTRQGISGGMPAASSSFPSVVAITLNGTIACSGVLITPTKVLSSANCFDPSSTLLQGAAVTPDEVRVYAGVTTVDAALPGLTVSGVDILARPPAFTIPDLSLLTLRTKTSLTPARLNLDPTRPAPGDTLTLVGFGPTRSLRDGGPDWSTSGELRSVALVNAPRACNSIAGPSPSFICYVQGGACYDYGGPSFLVGTDTVAGIHSLNDSFCSSFSFDTRIDANLTLIGPALCASDGYCAPDCGRATLQPDPDCPARDGGTSTDGGGTAGTPSVATDGGGTAGTPSVASGGATGGSPAGSSGSARAGAAGAGDAAGGAQSDGATTVAHDAGAAPSSADNRAAAASDAGGCGCRMARDAERGRGAPAIALAMLLCLLGRRSRRSASSRTTASHEGRLRSR